ncbi:MAG: class I adenylate-forming enzyme family protein [Thermoproteus sp.]
MFWHKATPKKTAVEDRGGGLSYGELEEAGRRWAFGGRSAYAARNSVKAFAALYGLLHGGGDVALIDALTISEDLAYMLEDFKPDFVVADDEFLERNKEVLRGYSTRCPDEPPGGKELVLSGRFVMYYAGIAGRTMQTINSVEALWLNALSLAAAMRLRHEDVVYVSPPMTHVLGLVSAFAALAVGATVRLMRGLDQQVVEELRGADIIVGVPAFYAELNKMGVGRLKARYAVSGGAYLPPPVKKEFEERTGVKILQLYGLTEGLVVSFQPPELGDVETTVGLPLPLVEVKLEPDGELLVRSPWNMLGYKEAEETAKALADGWLKTGDIMAVDDRGLLYFKGVKKRMIKYKGYPVFPRDLEEILKRHPAVKEVKVVGEPHPEYGELPVAYVVLREKADENELLNYVNSKVAFYKKIRKIYIVDKI